MQIRKLWKKFNDDLDKPKSGYQERLNEARLEHQEFLEKFPAENLKDMGLSDYTNIKQSSEDYFTYWLERKTESIGKFRTASSYAYGIYKVNPNNVPKEFENNAGDWKKKAENGYRTTAIKSESKDKFLTTEDAAKWFKENVVPKLIDLASFKDVKDLSPIEINYARKIAYLYNPDKLIPLYKKEVIHAIASYLRIGQGEFKDPSVEYKATLLILNKLKEDLAINEVGFEVTQKLGAFLWHYFGNQEPIEQNTIFYGAPGTGKTYSLQNNIDAKIAVEGGVKKFVQFHPSFGYEDFIDGLKPELSGDTVNLKLRNGVFKQFCIDAKQALIEFRKEGKEPPKYYFLVDEINRADLSAVFGEVLSCLEVDKRLDFDKEGNLIQGLALSSQNAYLIDKPEDAVYSDGDKHYFGIPSNLVFVGTMNDIDRSVDTFDFALRRRFTWIHKGFDAEVLANCDELSKLDDELENYIESCKALNRYISNELGLGRSFEIGHAYFMKASIYRKAVQKENDTIYINTVQKEKLFDQHLAPLIEEYLRSEYSAKDIEAKVKEARGKFIDPKPAKKSKDKAD